MANDNQGLTLTSWLIELRDEILRQGRLPSFGESIPGGLVIDQNTLKFENGVLAVNTTDGAEGDNTRPITSAGVHTIVGNIDALLSQI